jgi:hypothetical protein
VFITEHKRIHQSRHPLKYGRQGQIEVQNRFQVVAVIKLCKAHFEPALAQVSYALTGSGGFEAFRELLLS